MYTTCSFMCSTPGSRLGVRKCFEALCNQQDQVLRWYEVFTLMLLSSECTIQQNVFLFGKVVLGGGSLLFGLLYFHNAWS